MDAPASRAIEMTTTEEDAWKAMLRALQHAEYVVPLNLGIWAEIHDAIEIATSARPDLGETNNA